MSLAQGNAATQHDVRCFPSMTGALKRPSGARCVAAQDEEGSASEEASAQEEEPMDADEVSGEQGEEDALAEQNAEGDEVDVSKEPSPAEANSALTLANLSMVSKMTLQDTCNAHDV